MLGKVYLMIFLILLSTCASADFLSLNSTKIEGDIANIAINIADVAKSMPEKMAKGYLDFTVKMSGLIEQAFKQIIDAFSDFLSHGNFTIPPASSQS